MIVTQNIHGSLGDLPTSINVIPACLRVLTFYLRTFTTSFRATPTSFRASQHVSVPLKSCLVSANIALPTAQIHHTQQTTNTKPGDQHPVRTRSFLMCLLRLQGHTRAKILLIHIGVHRANTTTWWYYTKRRGTVYIHTTYLYFGNPRKRTCDFVQSYTILSVFPTPKNANYRYHVLKHLVKNESEIFPIFNN